MSDDQALAACAKCGQHAQTAPATVLMSASSAGVTGTAGGGPLCPSCHDDAQHLYALFSGDGLRFCGCGRPDEAYALVRDILSLVPFYEDGEDGKKNREKATELTGERAWYFVLYAIDSAGFIEHGTGIWSSWLTPKGTHYLPLMRRFGWDDFAQAGFPHQDGGDGECGPGCPHWEASTEDYVKAEVRREAKKRERAGDWQVLAPDVWTALSGAEASVLVKTKTWILSRPGRLRK